MAEHAVLWNTSRQKSPAVDQTQRDSFDITVRSGQKLHEHKTNSLSSMADLPFSR